MELALLLYGADDRVRFYREAKIERNGSGREQSREAEAQRGARGVSFIYTRL